MRNKYGYACNDALNAIKTLWLEGLLTMTEFSDKVAQAIREDDGIPF